MGFWQIIGADNVAYKFEDLGFNIVSVSGGSAPPVKIFGRPYATLPGETRDGERIEARTLTLVGKINVNGDQTEKDLNILITALLDVIKLDRSPRFGANSEPIEIRYVDSVDELAIRCLRCKYAGGFAGEAYQEGVDVFRNVSIQFIAQEEPFWCSGGEMEETLNHVTTLPIAIRYFVAKTNGTWNSIPVAPPLVGGAVNAIAIHRPTGDVYVAGQFQGWNGQAGLNYIARFVQSSQMWVSVGGPGAFNAAVYALHFSPDNDTLWIGGAFLNAGGLAAADYLAKYRVSSNLLTAVKIGGTGTVYTICTQVSTGQVYFGGQFLNWGGIGANNVAYYDLPTNSYNMLGVGPGTNDVVYKVLSSPTGIIYMCGAFTQLNGATSPYAVGWNSVIATPIDIVGTVSSPGIRDIALSVDGKLWAVGDFSGLDGVASKVAYYDGVRWVQVSGLPTPLSGLLIPQRVAIMDDGHVAVGYGTLANSGLSFWNGSAFVNKPIALPSNVTGVYALAVNGLDFFLGTDNSGSAEYPGETTITLIAGSAETYPRIEITSADGVSNLYSIRNETTRREMSFNLTILTGETIIIDLAARTITSSWGRTIQNQPLAGSDFANWLLTPGENKLNVYVQSVGGSVITAKIYYETNYWGFESADYEASMMMLGGMGGLGALEGS